MATARRGRQAQLGFALAFLLLFASACGGVGADQALLNGFAVSPTRVTPNGDGQSDLATIKYTLSRPAQVKVSLQDGAGRSYLLQQGERTAGNYETTFDGSVPVDEGELVRRALPAGDYQVVVEATADGGTLSSRGELRLADNDAAPPALADLVASPAEISPFAPEFARETKISFRLNKPGTVTAFAVEPDGRRSRLAEPQTLTAGAHSLTWDGLIRNRVPEAGTYSLLVQTRDAAGNVVERATPVRLAATVEPDAAVIKVDFSPRQLAKGDLLKVEITVRNTGQVPLRSQGPPPGYVYTTHDTFASIEGGRYAEASRLWRVGVDWAGGLVATEGARYPFRWGLGKDLAPGEQTTVTGYVRILEDYNQLRFYGGLLCEQVKYQGDRLGQTMIEVSH